VIWAGRNSFGISGKGRASRSARWRDCGTGVLGGWRACSGPPLAGKRDPIQTKILTERVLGVFDDLLGKAAWSPPRDSGLVFALDNKEGTADHSRQL
jgi:hypothetical protein